MTKSSIILVVLQLAAWSIIGFLVIDYFGRSSMRLLVSIEKTKDDLLVQDHNTTNLRITTAELSDEVTELSKNVKELLKDARIVKLTQEMDEQWKVTRETLAVLKLLAKLVEENKPPGLLIRNRDGRKIAVAFKNQVSLLLVSLVNKQPSLHSTRRMDGVVTALSNGVTPEQVLAGDATGMVYAFSFDSAKLAWSTKVPSGVTGLTVVERLLYVQTNEDQLLVLDPETGKEILKIRLSE
jgi:hypothetical protein